MPAPSNAAPSTPAASVTAHPLVRRYDAIWESAAPEVRAGRVALDPWVTDKGRDTRRGVTLLARLAPDVTARVGACVDALLAREPEQYAQPAEDLHVTVLSVVGATAGYAPDPAELDAYRAAVAEAAVGTPAFTIEHVGLTLSTAAVLVQGFPADDALARLRDRLRETLAERGLDGAMDRRYRLETAHTTVLRFAAPLRDPVRFVDALAAMRRLAFGRSRVAALELTCGDWYETASLSRPLATIALDGEG